MAELTLAEAQAELALVNIAIQDVIAGKRVTELKLGNAEFANWYKFTDTPLEDLRAYRQTLLDRIASLSPDAIPVFKANACIPLVVRKGRY